MILYDHLFKMVILDCPFDGCGYKTPDESGEVLCTLLKIHAMVHEQQIRSPQRQGAGGA